MKVAIFLPSGNLGGAEQVLLQIAIYYSVEGHEVSIISLTSVSIDKLKAKIVPYKINLIYFESHRESVGALKLLFSTLTNLGHYNFDMTYSSHVHLNAYVSLLRKCRLIRIEKHVVRESTLIFDRFKGYKLKLFSIAYDIGYGNADLVICQTEMMKAQLVANKPKINSHKIKVLNNPVTLLNKNYSFLNPLPKKPYLVSAGRLISEKGFDILIDVFHSLNEEWPNLHLVILGEGPKRTELENQILRLGIKDKVHLAGWKEDVYSYFRFAETCVVSSRIEGFPNVLLQMMMVNNAVVSTTCAQGISEIEGLITCSVEDAHALKSSIGRSLKDRKYK